MRHFHSSSSPHVTLIMCTQSHHSCGPAYAALPTNPNPNLNPLLSPADRNDDAPSSASISICSSPIHFLGMIFTSWLNRRRLSRCLFLLFCSPLLLPLLCATFPLILSLEIFFRFCRRRRRRGKLRSPEGFDGRGGDGLRRSEEGRCDEKALLHRYLQDQLVLVIGSVYRGEEEEEDGNGVGLM
nr:uncharacterized protein LOC104104392 [Ipomoea batatas]